MSQALSPESAAPPPLEGAHPPTPLRFDSIADGLAAIRNGESIVVVDDENRENEGDLICAAQFATPSRSISWPPRPGA